VHDLVERARTGDSRAQASLYQRVEPFLLAQAERLLAMNGPGKSVRDLVGDTWVRILQGQESFRGGGDDEQTGAMLRAWLATTMRHVLCNDLRRPAPRGVISVDRLGSDVSAGPPQPLDGGPTPSADTSDSERRAALQQALSRLDATDRYIVRAVFFEDMSYGKIAEVVKLSYEQVRYRFHKSLELLAPALRGWQ
jgi:RNA polymerase sigma factor (sigma-70 family)